MTTIDSAIRPVIWLRRYLPSEVVGLIGVLASILITLSLTGNVLLASLISAWVETILYYALMIWRELRAREAFTLGAAQDALSDLLLEFGPAEFLDSLLVRPASLAAGLTFAPSPALGAILGKLVADVVFYLPTIASYELLCRRRLKAGETGR